MAVEADIIDRIRRRVRDTGSPPTYLDVYYQDSIWRGLIRVNIDLAASPEFILATLTSKPELLVEIRATIEMAHMRASEATSSDTAVLPATSAQTVSIPNLSVTKAASTMKGPQFWMDLVDDLEKEYADILDACAAAGQTASSSVTVGVLVRKSLRTGRRTSRWQDSPYATPVLSAVLEDGEIALTWTTIKDEYFWYYKVYRSADPAMANKVHVATIYDNHASLHYDTPVAGTWYYTVTSVNSSDLKALSAIQSVVMP